MSLYTQNISTKHRISWFTRLSVTADNFRTEVYYNYEVANVVAIDTNKRSIKTSVHLKHDCFKINSRL